ncbi:MAG TPA: hypothetical protein VID30_14600 [Bradyrhizobium sp.]|jgi:hypothetical protein
MRKSNAAVVAAGKTATDARSQASVQLVCLALAVSVVALACGIFSLW